MQLLSSGRLGLRHHRGYGHHRRHRPPARLLQDEVLHLRDRSDDGLIGRSRLQRAAAVVQAGLSIQDFANALYRNGVNPSRRAADGRKAERRSVGRGLP